MIELSNVDWEGIFYSLKKSLRITSESGKKPTDVECETDLISLTYLKTDEENNNISGDVLKENKIVVPQKDNKNMVQGINQNLHSVNVKIFI